ncbi:MAG: 2-dehydropantoate 2-reductase [Peptococcaceae bacterium]|nr:2-dehydropantoate 2-reductase [Peptococcaceae bacterium]
MRTAIMGAGSLGIIIGALIAGKGKEVDLIDADRDNVNALNENGATVTGFMEFNVPVRAITPDEMTGKYDLVILLTKQTNNEAALKQLLPRLHEKSTVCTLQNGIPEESVASYVGRERTVGGAVGFGATWIKPGVSMLTSPAETVRKFAFDIGEMDGSITPRLQQVKEVLELAGGCHMLTNLMGIRWTKLLMNATFSGMSAALGCTFGDVLNDEEAMFCVARIADESIKAARAAGHRLVEMQGVDFEFLELKDDADIPGKMDFYRKVWGPHGKLKASMLQDLEKGRKTEIDYINGVVSRKGRESGLPTPYNDKVVELVKEAESRGVVPDFRTNIKRFNI